MRKLYQVAWENLLIVLEKGYDIGCWIAPIPEEHKEQMLLKAQKYLERQKRQKELF